MYYGACGEAGYGSLGLKAVKNCDILGTMASAYLADFHVHLKRNYIKLMK